MTLFKRISFALVCGFLLLPTAQIANATVANVSFEAEISLASGIGSIGDTWQLSFAVDNGDATFEWDQGDIIDGIVLGTTGSGDYSASIEVTGAVFDLETDALGNVLSVTYSDLDNLTVGHPLDSLGGLPLQSLNNIASTTGGFAFFAPLTDDSAGWTVEIDLQQGGGDPVPEPGVMGVFGIGLVGLAALARRRKRLIV